MSRTSYSSVSEIHAQIQETKFYSMKNKMGEVKDSSSSDSNFKNDQSSCSTPLRRRLECLREKLEYQDSKTEVADKTSPTLTMLRMTPGHKLKEKQQILIDKHNKLKQKLDKVNVGGGVTLWPAMDKMRLTQREITELDLLYKCCQNSHRNLKHFGQKIRFKYQEIFRFSPKLWCLGIHPTERCCLYQMFFVTYLFGLGILVYYLADNMFSKSRLSPRRIRIWVCLLTVIGTWTVLMIYFLILAYRLENAVEANVQQLFEILADLIGSDYDLQQFNMVLKYWQTRCLQPTASGILVILGVLPVSNVAYYLQYYSLPVITVLVTPIVKLVSALYQVYGNSSKL